MPSNYKLPLPALFIPHDNAVLVVEDNGRRIEWFRAKLGPNTFYATTPEEGVSLVGSRKYNCIFLDHDCSDVMVTDPYGWDQTFRPVVKKIKEVYGDALPTIVVHSMNPVGAKWINDAFRNHGHVWPFGKFNVERVDRLEWIGDGKGKKK